MSTIEQLYIEYDIADYLDHLASNCAWKELREEFNFHKSMAKNLVKYHAEQKERDNDNSGDDLQTEFEADRFNAEFRREFT